jgi:uncharacterized protein YPO0396
MSDYGRIANTETVLSREAAKEGIDSGCKGFHESVLRAHQILQKVKWLLKQGTTNEVTLELIALMESDEFQPYAWHEKKYNDQSQPGEIIYDLTRRVDAIENHLHDKFGERP